MPFALTGVGLFLISPVAAPVALVLLAKAWIIPELYAQRGGNVLRRRARPAAGPDRRALGLLGDLVGHHARELLSETGLVLERGRLGTWLVGEAGAVLVRPGGRRVFCYCVAPTDRELPGPDRVAHLLLALREDEQGFATVANVAFSGAPWRLRRRLPDLARPALAATVAAARA